MGTESWDLVVVGSGGAAMAAGIEARSRGARVLLVEQGPLGGTCLNIGCVPRKNLLAAAGLRHRALANPFPMVSTRVGGLDMASLVAQKQQPIDQLREAKYQRVADAHGFRIRYGHAAFADEATLLVDGERLPAAAYVLATGAVPNVPGIPGLERVDYLTSTTAMELTRLPESLIVLGGGFVGMEQAQLFAFLGVRVTVVGRLAPHTEPEVAQVMRQVFAGDGISVVEEHGTSVTGDRRGVTVTTSSGVTVTGERLLLAAGRVADTAALQLARADVAADDRGFIRVDEHQQTTNPRVFAAGDASGAPQHVYVAAQTGHAAAAGALGDPTTVDYRGLPAVTFTTPQIGGAGLTEAQALGRGQACRCRVLGAQDIPRALANRDARGALKLVADARVTRGGSRLTSPFRSAHRRSTARRDTAQIRCWNRPTRRSSRGRTRL